MPMTLALPGNTVTKINFTLLFVRNKQIALTKRRDAESIKRRRMQVNRRKKMVGVQTPVKKAHPVGIRGQVGCVTETVGAVDVSSGAT